MKDKAKEEKQQNIEQLLMEGKTVQIFPRGYSMYPLFVPGRDQAVIAPVDIRRLKRGDVVLYRRREGILVLHRLCRRKKNPEGYYFVGDNQVEVEGPLDRDQLRGVMVRFVRHGRSVSVKHPVYVAASTLWLWLRPVRRSIQLFVAGWKRRIGKHR